MSEVQRYPLTPEERSTRERQRISHVDTTRACEPGCWWCAKREREHAKRSEVAKGVHAWIKRGRVPLLRPATPADRERCAAIVGEPMCRHDLPARTCGYCKGTE